MQFTSIYIYYMLWVSCIEVVHQKSQTKSTEHNRTIDLGFSRIILGRCFVYGKTIAPAAPTAPTLDFGTLELWGRAWIPQYPTPAYRHSEVALGSCHGGSEWHFRDTRVTFEGVLEFCTDRDVSRGLRILGYLETTCTTSLGNLFSMVFSSWKSIMVFEIAMNTKIGVKERRWSFSTIFLTSKINFMWENCCFARNCRYGIFACEVPRWNWQKPPKLVEEREGFHAHRLAEDHLKLNNFIWFRKKSLHRENLSFLVLISMSLTMI